MYCLLGVIMNSFSITATCLEGLSSIANFDAGVVRQVCGVGSDVFNVSADRRIVMTHVGDQYRVVFSHCHAAYA